MPEDQQEDSGSRPEKPRLRVSIRPEGAGTEPTSTAEARPPTPDSSSNSTGKERAGHPATASAKPSPGKQPRFWHPENLPADLQWIPANWTWSKWKPVLRSALAAWIGLLLFIIPKTLNMMGQAAFLIIVASFFSPPSDPFVAVLQRELGILTFVVSGWAWSCLGIKLADLARSNKDPTASPASIFSGQYIEPAPSIILAVFMFIGSVFYLYFKSRLGPGPLTVACVFGCIFIDISLTTAVLFPYPYYTIGQYVVVPMTLHSAISLVISLVLFPSSESTVFTTRLRDVLSSLVSATKEHSQHLQQDVTASDFSAASIIAAASKAEGALAMLAAAARLQRLDVNYCRFSPTDFTQLHKLTRQLIVKSNGMNVYYTLIDPTREKFPNTPVVSAPGTPTLSSPTHSRPPSPGHGQPLDGMEKPHTPDGGTKGRLHHRHHTTHGRHTGVHHRKRLQSPHRHTASHHSVNSHGSLLHLALSHATRTESAVGVFESLRYLNLEATHMSHPDSEAHDARSARLLNTSCQELLKSCEIGLQGVCDWLSSLHNHRFTPWISREEMQRIRADRMEHYKNLSDQLSQNLDEFTHRKRFAVLDPYRAIFTADDTSTVHEMPSHRHLFHCYVFQYHLMRFAVSTRDMLDEVIRLETERPMPRLWFPKIDWSRLMHRKAWEPTELGERDDDENPDSIPGMEPTPMADLGEAVRRDPDALPPQNVLERSVNWMYQIAKGIGGGNALFALKAGILTILLALPSFLKSSGAYAYKNKFVWAVIMGQLTLSRFRGDTAFGLVTRIISTFVGGIIGTLIWYISAGSGKGNPFGLAAVCFVCFPIIFYFRLYWPAPPMTNMIIWVTAALVFGYSYQDTRLLSASSPGYGIDVAWKRFVLVTVGVVAAGIFSFLPPSTTIRLYQRKTLATASTEIGSVYCSVISFGHTKKEGESPIIVQHLLAILSKLKRSIVLKQNVVYEFSLRGKWPAERYQRILELQIQISNLLSQLTLVLEQLEPAWAHAFLKRTRLSDADFQGDVLAVMTLISSSLRTGNPLPQVTPCPLLDRFLERYHGLNVVHEESEDDFGLPKVLTEETLQSLQYMIFCVGVSTTFGIVVRLDKLMLAVKELVGEQYHIDGVGLPLYHRRGRGVEIRSVPSIMMESNV